MVARRGRANDGARRCLLLRVPIKSRGPSPSLPGTARTIMAVDRSFATRKSLWQEDIGESKTHKGAIRHRQAALGRSRSSSEFRMQAYSPTGLPPRKKSGPLTWRSAPRPRVRSGCWLAWQLVCCGAAVRVRAAVCQSLWPAQRPTLMARLGRIRSEVHFSFRSKVDYMPWPYCLTHATSKIAKEYISVAGFADPHHPCFTPTG